MNRLVFRNDNQWNVNGHEIAAKAIAETLMNAGVIDEQYLAQNCLEPSTFVISQNLHSEADT